MSLNIGAILGTVAQGFAGTSNPWTQGLSAGANIASAFFQPNPAPAPTPAMMIPYGGMNFPQQQQQPVHQVGAFAVGANVAAALTARLAPVLTKIAVKLGLRAKPSLNRAMEIVRKAAKLLGSPEAVAVALGITTAELAQLITAQSARKRRRMNPANSRALRRAARRIKSFHRMCQHVDLLKGRRRSAAPVYAFQRRRKKCA